MIAGIFPRSCSRIFDMYGILKTRSFMGSSIIDYKSQEYCCAISLKWLFLNLKGVNL